MVNAVVNLLADGWEVVLQKRLLRAEQEQRQPIVAPAIRRLQVGAGRRTESTTSVEADAPAGLFAFGQLGFEHQRQRSELFFEKFDALPAHSAAAQGGTDGKVLDVDKTCQLPITDEAGKAVGRVYFVNVKRGVFFSQEAPFFQRASFFCGESLCVKTFGHSE